MSGRSSPIKAPREDGAILALPDFAAAPDQVRANVAWFDRWTYDFQGRDVARLRAMARSQALARSNRFLEQHGLTPPSAPTRLDQPLVVTGHQPELFHPGVWIKNFAVAGLARQVGGWGMNLIVDNDTLKRTFISVPRWNSNRPARIDFDTWNEELPQEDHPVQDEQLFTSFGQRVDEALKGEVADPLIQTYWSRVMELRRRTPLTGLCLAFARHQQEVEWGVSNHELALSQLCETEAFAWFACHLLAHLNRFRSIHNTALEAYRRVNKIRSRHHPVPALRREGEWLEAPFWGWSINDPRRHPIMARMKNADREIELRLSGEESPFLSLPLGPDRDACCAVERLLELPSRGIRFRTRALTTTLFARLLLADLFIHGIGGAKYDELGDTIATGFFGVEPPAFLTLSLTLRLSLPIEPVSDRDLVAIDRLGRDLQYNPDRHLQPPYTQPLEQALQDKREAIDRPQETHLERVNRFRAIRQSNDRLAPFVQDQVAAAKKKRAEILEGLQRNQVSQSREYASVLHSTERLRQVFQKVAP